MVCEYKRIQIRYKLEGLACIDTGLGTWEGRPVALLRHEHFRQVLGA